jgi:hypothetical protein
MRPSITPSVRPSLLSVPETPVAQQIRNLKRWILSAFVLGTLFSLGLSTLVVVKLHSELIDAIRASVRVEIEKEYEAKHFNEVFTEVLSRPKTVNAMCKKWWFDMDHTQRRINP